MPTDHVRRSVSRRTALAGLGTSGLGLALAARPARAQDETETTTATAGHPIVGSWQWENNPGTPEARPSFAAFHADGAYVEFYPPLGVGIGAWAGSGERSAILTIKFQDTNIDDNVIAPGVSTYRIDVEVDESGTALTGTGDLEVLTSDGAALELVPFTGQATRVLPEPPGSSATPEATPQASAGGD